MLGQASNTLLNTIKLIAMTEGISSYTDQVEPL